MHKNNVLIFELLIFLLKNRKLILISLIFFEPFAQLF